MLAIITGDRFADGAMWVSALSVVLGLILALVVYPWRLRVRLGRQGKTAGEGLGLGTFLWPPLGGLIVLMLLLAVLQTFDSRLSSGEPPVGTGLGYWAGGAAASAVVGVLIFLTAWPLMASSGKRKTGLPARAFWRPALVLAMLTASSGCFWLLGLNRARSVAKRTIDRMHLAEIGNALHLYRDSRGGYPDDLRRLVDDGSCPPEALVKFWKHDPLPERTTQPYAGPCDFAYRPAACGRGDLVCAWLDPKFMGGEIAYALYGDGRVRELSPGELAAEVERTRRWAEEHRSDGAAEPGEAETRPAGPGLR